MLRSRLFFQFLLILGVFFFSLSTTTSSLAQADENSFSFTYVRVDSTRTINDSNTESQQPKRKWFGFAVGDVNGDGYPDIGAGKWLYLNPGTELQQSPWERHTLKDSLDIILILPTPSGRSDILALRCNEQYRVRWVNRQFQYQLVGTEPICDHVIGSMGYTAGSLSGQKQPDIVINSQKGEALYAFIPSSADTLWQSTMIAQKLGVEKGLAIEDVNHDGRNDVVIGTRPAEGGFTLSWLHNTNAQRLWNVHRIDTMSQKPDRIAVADLNGDGQHNIIVAQGQWPGDLPEAQLLWYEQQSDTTWVRHLIGRQYSTNSLAVADVDGDGDQDLVTGEHKGPHPKTQLWENDGQGHFTEHIIDQGKEHHMGTLLIDLDLDGDLDIASAGYDEHQYVHVWINQGGSKP